MRKADHIIRSERGGGGDTLRGREPAETQHLLNEIIASNIDKLAIGRGVE